MKMAIKRKPTDRLVNRKSTNKQKNTASYSSEEKRNVTSRTPAIGPYDPLERGSTIEDRPNI